MFTSLLLFGKRGRGAVREGDWRRWPPPQSPLLHHRSRFGNTVPHWHRSTGQRHPPLTTDSRSPSTLTFQAVNNTSIRIYGSCSLSLNLGLQCTFRWVFVVDDVTNTILGADFLQHYSLMVDLGHPRLVDAVISLHVQGIISAVTSPSPSLLPRSHPNPLATIIAEFPSVTQPSVTTGVVKHSVTHHITTVRPPIPGRAGHLSPERLQIARREFDHMLELGIIQPSSSSWSSLLHMVPKKVCNCLAPRMNNKGPGEHGGGWTSEVVDPVEVEEEDTKELSPMETKEGGQDKFRLQ